MSENNTNLTWPEIFTKFNINEENMKVDGNYKYTSEKTILNNPHINTNGYNLEQLLNGSDFGTYTMNNSQEMITIEEKVHWLESSNEAINLSSSWIKIAERKLSIEDETKYCDRNLLKEVLKAKGIFDELDAIELCKARSRANPFETLKSAFFMNRAALKMANIDAATDFLFTTVDRQKEHRQSECPYYFADICAGPGGFSEYILWRKRWAFKGFGLTLRGEHDFKVHESTCAPSETFEAFYGVQNDGDIYYPENIQDFSERVKMVTQGKGVHFVMADGGFSVEGQENLQEILSRQIYICQCFLALKSLRFHGHFVVKLFDLFTPFSVGLMYLMYRCFEKVSILKPNSSRPANSERYLICNNLKNHSNVTKIIDYMTQVVQILYKMRLDSTKNHLDILEIVPDDILQADLNFLQYITYSNNRLAKKQIIGLMKLEMFCRDPALFEPRQEDLRQKCLAYWRIPDKPKVILPFITSDDLIASAFNDLSFMYSYPTEIATIEDLNDIFEESEDWYYTFVASGKKCNLCNIYVCTGRNKVYRFQRNRWVRVKCLELMRGTILYGELVKEYLSDDPNDYKRSLHVIDALRLGETSLADLSYQERLDLIHIYGQAITRESRTDLASIRLKPVLPLAQITTQNPPTFTNNGEWLQQSTTYLTHSEPLQYNINSLLLLKTDSSMSFDTIIASRVLIDMPSILDFQNRCESDQYTIWKNVTQFSRENHFKV